MFFSGPLRIRIPNNVSDLARLAERNASTHNT